MTKTGQKRQVRKPLVHKWFLRIWIERSGFINNDRFARTLHIAVLRLHHVPAPGVEATHGKDYAGVHFRLVYRVPAMVEAWR